MSHLFDIKYNKKIPFIHISKDSFYGIIFEFIVIGILGFIMESLLEYVFVHQACDRGFLCGPFIPIYAIFALIACFINIFPKFSIKNLILTSVSLFVGITIFEELVGRFCENAFGAVLWTYEGIILTSSSGYTNVLISLCWGLGGALYLLIAMPFIYKKTLSISLRMKRTISIEFFIVFIADIIYTFYRLNKYGEYKELFYHKASIDYTLFIIGIILYLIIRIFLFYFAYKKIIKINKKLDCIFFVIASIMISLPFFSAYDYLERSGVLFFERLAVFGYIDIAIFLYFVLAIILFFLIFSLYKLILKISKTNNEKFYFYRKMLFLPLILITSYIAGLVVVLIGISNVKNPVNTYLTYGKGNNSLKIVAVSDIHYDTTGCIIDLKDLVNDINKENPDIVFFLGDTVDNYMQNYSITTHESHPHFASSKVFASYMNKIHSTYGIYNISGNHEFEKNSLYEVSDFMKEVEVLSSNFHYLDNKAVNIDDKIVVVGRRDFIYNGKNNSRVSIETILMRNNLENTKLPIIVLDHQPQDYRNSIKAGATLQLSGHTHNGQIFPGNIILNIFEHIQYNCYSYGEYKENDFSMFITRGYGAWGFPLRTTGRSEILNINFLY